MSAAVIAYIGSRTTRERNARGDGITVCHIEPGTARLAVIQVVSELVNPSYLALSGDGRTLYTVHGDRQEVSALRVDPRAGTLALLGSVDCGGRNPVHLALAPSGGHLVVSNHLSSCLAVIGIEPDGRLGALEQRVVLAGEPGPHRTEQPFAKPHFNPFDRSGRHVVVPDKGLDRVFSLPFRNGRLDESALRSELAREMAGPRNAVFHPDNRRVYVVNELDSTVTRYDFDADSGALAPRQVLTTLEATFTGRSRAAGIAIDARGSRLYVSNRGADTIAVFDLDGDGAMAPSGSVACGGRTPRFFTLSPDGATLYVLNEDSDTIVPFAVDAATGMPRPLGWTFACGSPVCMVFAAAAP